MNKKSPSKPLDNVVETGLEDLIGFPSERLHDPKEVAKWVGQSLLHRARDLSSTKGLGRESVLELLDTPLPREIRSKYPIYDPGALLIHAWSALAFVPESTLRFPRIGEIVWANRSLRSALFQRSGREASSKLFARHLMEALSNFMREVSGNSAGEQEDVISFGEALQRAPQLVIGKNLSLLEEEAGAGVLVFDMDLNPVSGVPTTTRGTLVETFRQTSRLPGGGLHVVVGARAYHPGGIPLFLTSKPEGVSSDSAEYFDLYGVWNLDLPAQKGEPIEAERFVSVQGLFIPVDLRRRLHEKNLELYGNLQTAGLVSRNLSHNLGSHALLHLSRDLRSVPEHEDAGSMRTWAQETAVFLQYLANRADLVAMLASGNGHPFSVRVSLGSLIRQFSDQEIVRRYLCRTEGLVVSPMNEVGEEYQVECPGGPMGSQAFCAILENFARNSAKHAERLNPDQKTVDLHIEVKEPEDEKDYLTCRLTDKNAQAVSGEQLAQMNQILKDLLLKSELGSGSSHGDSDGGLGMLEMLAWARYLAFELNRPSAERVASAGIIFEQDSETKSLSLAFPMLKGRALMRADVAALSSESLPTAQLSLLRVDSSFELDRIRELSGRWLGVWQAGDRIEFRTRYGGFEDELEQWPDILSADPDKALEAALRAYLETLRRETLGSEKELHLVIIDWELQKTARKSGDVVQGKVLHSCLFELALPFRGVRAYLCKRSLDGQYLQPDTLLSFFPTGVLAIWQKHTHWLHSLAGTNLCSRLIHYEGYGKDGTQDYLWILNPAMLESRSGLLQVLTFLAEAALFRGYVLDERFARIHKDSLALNHRLPWMGIQVVDPLREGHGTLGPELRAVRSSNQASWPGAETPILFSSVHASLSRQQSLREEMSWSELIGAHNEVLPFVSLHSGRGGVEEARQLNLPFRPASLLETWLFERPCKLLLVESLLRGGSL